jgi:hypothetical protein
MKRCLILLVSGILTLSVTAQTITITFNGVNKTRNYQVLLDETSYYSNSVVDPNSTTTSVRKEIILTNQQPGSHTIEVYRLRNTGTNTNGTNITPSGRAIYTKTFELREGYDMAIAINGYGQVTFTEKRVRNRGNKGNNQQTVTPMSDDAFDELVESVSSKFSQSSKNTIERNAFSNTRNYFTTEQVGELLSLINSEANRLTLAKLAYPRVADPNNFTELYDVFNSISSRDQMNAFIRANPNNNRISGTTNTNNTSSSNNSSYRTPMAEYQFSQLLQTVNSQYSQSGKYSTISGSFNNSANYFSTAQVRQLLSVINSETDRLALAKQSYSRVSDPSNFTSLYDLFYTQAYRNDLNNYVIQNGGTGTSVQNNTRTSMADYQFSQLLQSVNSQYSQSGKYTTITGAFNNTSNYFTTAQVRQLLSVINSESERLALAKQSYSRVFDPANFSSLYDLFYTQAYRIDLNNYVIQNGGTGTTVQTNTKVPVSDALFSQLYQKAKSHIRPSSILEDLRTFFNNTTYNFTTMQIRQLLSLVSSSILSLGSTETDLLEVAKLSWHRVTDPGNFTQIFDLFTTQATRDSLNAYIQSHPL